MRQIRGYCRRLCNECEIFKVTQADDDQKKAAMAVEFSKLFDQDFKPEDIYCDGCSAKDGRLFRIAKKCSIRNREIQSRRGLIMPITSQIDEANENW
jgi:hypothetical protein